MSATKRRLWAALHLGGLSPREVAIRTWNRINEHEILTRAAAISFYAIAALVPFLALVITLTAYLLPSPVRQAVGGTAKSTGPADDIVAMLPGDAASVVVTEIRRLQEGPPTGLVSFGLAAILWLSSSVFVAIMDAMNRILGVRESRPWWKQHAIAMLIALSQAAILIIVFATMLAWPQILHYLGLDRTTAVLVTAAHGIVVLLVILLSFAMTLYFAPDADQCWEWITPGSLLGSVVLMLVSLLFRIYVQHWGNYGATYGSLGGIVLLMSWIWLCSLTLLAAAELNKVIKDASPLGDPCGPKSPNEDGHARELAPEASGRAQAARRN
jgi:membrane protein